MYKKGQQVKLSLEAIHAENYDDLGVTSRTVFVVTARSWMYMPAKEFYAKGMPDGYHPGYDEGSGGTLYDLDIVNGDGKQVEFGCSLYGWELRKHWRLK